MQKVLPLAVAVALAAAMIVPQAGAVEIPPIEISSPPKNRDVSTSFLLWTSFEDFQVAAPLAFNTPVYEATISAYHASLDFLSGTVAGWSDPENNGLYTGSWSLQSIGLALDGWTLRTMRWKNIINPNIHAADITGTFIARQFQIDWGQLHVGTELGAGSMSGYSQGAWGTATFPTISAEGIATIVYSLSPTLQIGYKMMDWITGSGPMYWSGSLLEYHQDF